MRACVTCGIPQQRWRDKAGVEHTNINPLTGECLDCLVKATAAQAKDPQPSDFDAKQAQVGRDD